MRLSVRALWVGASALAVAGVVFAHPGHPPIPTPTVTVAANPRWTPFELFRGNRMFVAAEINGHRTQVMLDTGASLTTINRTYARSIGLPEGFKIEAKGIGGTVEAEMVTGLDLHVGGLSIAQASAGVMDLSPIERIIGRPINAILGRDVFNSGVISIDWAKKQLVIRSHESFRPAAGSTAVALSKKGPFNTIPVSIMGAAPIDALLDVGNGGTLALQPAYWAGRPEFASLRTAAFEEGGVGGIRDARLVTVPKVGLGGQTFTAVPAALAGSGPKNDPTQMANVGIGLLKQFKVDLDLGRDRIFLAPRTDHPAFDRNRAGLRLELADDRLKVVFVSPEGPGAAAGLKAGDEIAAVDGRKVTSSYYDIPDWGFGPAGKTVVLTRSDGTKVRVTLSDYY